MNRTISVLLAFALAACGGGDSGTTTVSPPPEEEEVCKWSRTLRGTPIPAPLIFPDSTKILRRVFTSADTFPAGLNIFVRADRKDRFSGMGAFYDPKSTLAGEYGFIVVGSAPEYYAEEPLPAQYAFGSFSWIHEIGHVLGLVPGEYIRPTDHGWVSNPKALQAFRAMGGTNYPHPRLPTVHRVHWDNCSGISDLMISNFASDVEAAGSIIPVSLALLREPFVADLDAPPIVPYLPDDYKVRRWEMIDRVDTTAWNRASWSGVNGLDSIFRNGS